MVLKVYRRSISHRAMDELIRTVLFVSDGIFQCLDISFRLLPHPVGAAHHPQLIYNIYSTVSSGLRPSRPQYTKGRFPCSPVQ